MYSVYPPISAIRRTARSGSMPGGSYRAPWAVSPSRTLLADAAASVVCTPTEADRMWLGRQWRTRQLARGRLQVVGGRRHVVRRVRMEQRGQVLELTSPRALLEHPAAVGADAAGEAIVV